LKDVILCGHTGSYNRGCEAIIKGTAEILKQQDIIPLLATQALNQDIAAGINEFQDVLTYQPLNGKRLQLFIGRVINRLSRTPYGTEYFHQRAIWRRLKGNVAMNVGGDTYCYDLPRVSLALNWYTTLKKIPNILWACSIEDTAITNVIKEDLERYDLIMPRETLTFQNLIHAGIDRKKLRLCADPAFVLPKQDVDIDQTFFNQPVVGINASPLVMDSCDQQGMVVENFDHMVDYILKETAYNICLIPHVYSAERLEDLLPLTDIYNRYKRSNRVMLIDKAYNCEQLKTIISKCSLFVCARTHASIAAYSSLVPTLVLGYSVKSKGIANDLFGTYQNYVISAQQLKRPDELKKGFIWLDENKQNISDTLVRVMPEYKQKALDSGAVIKQYVESRFSVGE